MFEAMTYDNRARQWVNVIAPRHRFETVREAFAANEAHADSLQMDGIADARYRVERITVETVTEMDVDTFMAGVR